MNEEIVKRIKKVRIDKSLTQQDLANHLGKTAAAISDLERGKVQVSAVDLHKISILLDKPIQYFYGATLLDEDDDAFILETQKMKQGTLKEFLRFVKLGYSLAEFQDKLEQTYEADQIISLDDTEEFYKILTPYFAILQDRMNKALTLKRKIDKAFENVPQLDDSEAEDK